MLNLGYIIVYFFISFLLFQSCRQEVSKHEDQKIVSKMYLQKYRAFQDAFQERELDIINQLILSVLDDIEVNNEIKNSKVLILNYIDSLENLITESNHNKEEQKFLKELKDKFGNPKLTYVQAFAFFDDLLGNEYLNGLGDSWDEPKVLYESIDTMILEPGKNYVIPISVVWRSSRAKQFTILKINQQDSVVNKIQINTPKYPNESMNKIYELEVVNNLTQDRFTIMDTLAIITK